jgi:hypothetical protein
MVEFGRYKAVPLIESTTGPTLPPPPVLDTTPADLERRSTFEGRRGEWQATESPHYAHVGKRSRHRRISIALIVMLAGVGYGLFVSRSESRRDPLTQAGFTPVSGFSVETPAFRFVMPQTPTVETVSVSSLGVPVTGTAWTIKTDDMLLQVLAIDSGTPLDEVAAQARFESVIQGVAQRSNGEVVSDEPVERADAIERHVEIDLARGRIFTRNYAHGTWAVMIMVGTVDEVAPNIYTDLFASFEFL